MSPAESAPSAGQLTQNIEEYLADHPAAALLEDGRVLFDMRIARYAVSEQHGRCLLQLWSEERNLMRTVVEVQERAQCLRLLTRRMGAAKPQALELVPTSDRRTPTARDAARRNYQRLLERVLTRAFIWLQGGWTALGDGPGAQLRSGLCARTAAARHGGGRGDRRERGGVRGDDRRHSDAGDSVARLLPPTWRRAAALWRAQDGGPARRMADDCGAHGLAESRRRRLSALHPRRAQRRTCVRWIFAIPAIWNRGWCMRFRLPRPMERCQAGIDRLMALVPPAAKERVEMRPRSATEVGLLLHGLEFARVRHGVAAHSFAREDEVTFGAGANETPLTAGERGALPRVCLRGSSSAGIPMARTPTRSFACSRSAGLSRACAETSANCCRACAAT